MSPAQEHVEGPEWWTDYQPVSYEVKSKRGDKIQYRNMIQTCHEAGVKVIAGWSVPPNSPYEVFDAVSRYYMESHDSTRFRDWRRGEQFVTPALHFSSLSESVTTRLYSLRLSWHLRGPRLPPLWPRTK